MYRAVSGEPCTATHSNGTAVSSAYTAPTRLNTVTDIHRYGDGHVHKRKAAPARDPHMRSTLIPSTKTGMGP